MVDLQVIDLCESPRRLSAMYVRIAVFCFILLSVNSRAWTAETYFELLDNEGNSLIGVITALDQTQVAVNVQGTSHTLPLDILVKIRNMGSNPYGVFPPGAGSQNLSQQILSATRGEIERRVAVNLAKTLQPDEQTVRKTLPNNIIVLELKDGSLLAVSSFSVSNNQGIFRFWDQQEDFSLPLNSLSAVRFAVSGLSEVARPPADWLRLAVPGTEGDKLVVGNAGSFDVYTGILDKITAETISFSLDGEVLPVPRRKVYGLVLHHESPLTNTNSLGTLTLWNGTKGMISEMRLSGDELTWQTFFGLNVTVPLEMVEEIVFGEKGVAYLADLELVRSEFSLPFESDIKPTQMPLLKTFYEQRSKKMLTEAVLDGTVFKHSITLKGKTLLEYRLPKSFTSLKAVLGIEDQYRPYASVTVQILADSQMLGMWELRGDSPSEPIHLNLPQQSRLLTIIAEPPQQSNVPAVLTIGGLKLFE